MKQGDRVVWLDCLKGLAILFVIIGHGPLISQHIHDFIWAFHMPLFFLIAGYTFKANHTSNQEFRKKKAKRLLLPYVFTTIALLICGIAQIIISNEFTWNKVGATIYRWLFGGIYGSCWSYEEPFKIYDIGAIWFLIALFCAELVFNEILRLDEFLVPIVVIVFAYIGIETRHHIWLPWGIQSSLVCTIFLYVGWLARKYNLFEKRIAPIMHYVLLSVSVICIWKKSFVIIGNNSYTYGWVSIIGAICISYYLTLLCKDIIVRSSLMSKLLTFLGRNTMIILCFHLMELDYLPWTVWIDFFERAEWNYILIIILKVSWAIAWIWIVNKNAILRRIFK